MRHSFTPEKLCYRSCMNFLCMQCEGYLQERICQNVKCLCGYISLFYIPKDNQRTHTHTHTCQIEINFFSKVIFLSSPFQQWKHAGEQSCDSSPHQSPGKFLRPQRFHLTDQRPVKCRKNATRIIKSSCLSKKESTGFEEAQVPEQIFDLNVELMWPALSAPQFLFSHTELTH